MPWVMQKRASFRCSGLAKKKHGRQQSTASNFSLPRTSTYHNRRVVVQFMHKPLRHGGGCGQTDPTSQAVGGLIPPLPRTTLPGHGQHAVHVSAFFADHFWTKKFNAGQSQPKSKGCQEVYLRRVCIRFIFSYVITIYVITCNFYFSVFSRLYIEHHWCFQAPANSCLTMASTGLLGSSAA